MVTVNVKQNSNPQTNRAAKVALCFLGSLLFVVGIYQTSLSVTSQSLQADSLLARLGHLQATVLPEHPLQALPLQIRQQNCPATIDSLRFVVQRLKRRQSGKITWQQDRTVNDKWGFYFFAKKNGFPVPTIYHCSAEGPDDLVHWEPAVELAQRGFVVKVRDGRSAKGVYLLPSGFGGKEVLSGRDNFTKQKTIDDMKLAFKSLVKAQNLVRGKPDRKTCMSRSSYQDPMDALPMTTKYLSQINRLQPWQWWPIGAVRLRVWPWSMNTLNEWISMVVFPIGRNIRLGPQTTTTTTIPSGMDNVEFQRREYFTMTRKCVRNLPSQKIGMPF